MQGDNSWKMAQNDIDDVLDHLRRIKSRGDQSSIKTDQIETLEMHLRFLRTFIKYHHVILPDFIVKIKKKAKLIVKKLHLVFGGIPDECKNNLILERLKSLFLEFIEGNTSSVCNFELNDDSDLSEYMDCLGNNLNDVLMCLELERSDPSSTNKQILLYNRGLKQVKIIQKKMRFLRYLYATEINGCVDHEKLDGLETHIQFMADNVGQFCLALFVNRDDTSTDEDEDDTNSDEDEGDIYIVVDEDEDDTSSDEDDILSKPPYLLCLIVLVELEMKKIFLGELKASKFSQSRTFKDKKLPKGFSYYLRNLLVYLRNEKLKNFPTDVTARNIDVAIEFLLFLLGDVPNHVINGNSLNEVLEKIGVLVGNILYLIQMLLVGSIIKEDTRKIELGTIQILEKTEDLKAQVEEGYKSLKYSPSNEFPIVGGLSFLDSLLRKLNEMLKSESSLDLMMKPSIGILEEELSSLTFVFRDVTKVQHKHDEILNDLQRRTVNLAYEAEASIDSILVQYNFLWHFSCSLPAIIKEIKHMRVQVMEVRCKNLLPAIIKEIKHIRVPITCKDMTPGPNLTPKATSRGEDFLSPYKQIATPFPNQSETLTLSNTPLHAQAQLERGPGAQTGVELTLIPCKDVTPRSNSIPKASSSGEDCPSPYKQIATSFPNQCGTLTHSNTIQHSNPVNDEEIVGFENDIKRIIQCLIQGTNELDVIPIVGMGGQGKTTIARKVYNNEQIVFHFDHLAWCIISQTCKRRELLQEIFSQVTGSKDKVDVVSDLADMLRKRLMHKRYLIVLDDMWDVAVWEDLILSFPNGENGSRIIVTTRLENVGKQVKYHTDPYSLPFLSLDESCKLLQKKVFQQEDCPPELQDVTLAVAERCKGLPLVVVLVAGIIKKNKMEASWWDKVKNSLLSYLGESEGISLATMQLSYDNLTDYLKPCLLYMGMFPEDARIPVSKLISLWIAEGFVQNIESGRLMEETAEDYLNDLISSNVIMVSRRRYNGKVKYCQVHDVVLHFCLEKSREEKFMLALKGQFQPSRWKESRVSFSFSEELSKFASLGSNTRKPFHQHLRSLIMTNGSGFPDRILFNKCSKLRLLKVLDLSFHNVINLWSVTLKPLIHLKYLAVTADKFHFHPELHLPHLETLIVKYMYGHTVLPVIFWKMEKLRRVEIGCAVVDLEEDRQWMFEESPKLESLRILKEIEINDADGVDVLKLLGGRCPNLQELDISYMSSICPKLDNLTQLQVLRLSGRKFSVVSELHLPSSLKKLVLRWMPIESAISFIGELPRLEYLQLWDFTQSEEWCLPIDITFHKLKVLKLRKVDISRWDASEESFPQLETLVIKWCDYLKEIPHSFEDIPTLKQIKLINCRNKSLEASAVKIKEEVADIEGCNRIYVNVKDWWGNQKQL